EPPGLRGDRPPALAVSRGTPGDPGGPVFQARTTRGNLGQTGRAAVRPVGACRVVGAIGGRTRARRSPPIACTPSGRPGTPGQLGILEAALVVRGREREEGWLAA